MYCVMRASRRYDVVADLDITLYTCKEMSPPVLLTVERYWE